MKKIIPVVFVVVVAALLGYFILSGQRGLEESPTTPAAGSGTTKDATPAGGSADFEEDLLLDDDEYLDEEIKPAAELYKTSDDAFEAVKKGAVDYDDLVLEQFVDPGKDCDWCPEFYQRIRERMVAVDATEDEQSYYGEILAISNRKENIAALIDAVKNAPTEELEDIYMEALELTMGDNDIVTFLGDQLGEADEELLQESLVAALTNHGSKEAVDLMYQFISKQGDADGYYSVGIGPGEMILNEESLPYATEILYKDEKFAPLFFKSLLNSDYEGFSVAMTYLETLEDEQQVDRVLEDAIDHVICGDDTEGYCQKSLAGNVKPGVSRLCREILDECGLADEE